MRVYLIGVGMGNPDTLTVGAERAIRESGLLIGANRLLEPFQGNGCETLALIKPDDIVAALANATCEQASVLLSGDVGFYSGATALYGKLADFEVEVIPGISSLVYFCAKLRTPWQDATLVSAHGRDHDAVGAIQTSSKTFCITGGKTKVEDVCRDLVERGMGDVSVAAGERLSYDDERIVRGTAAELAEMSFTDLSVMLAENPHPVKRPFAALTRAGGDTAHVKGPFSKEGACASAAPRIVIGAPASGGGKTTFTCGLLQALVRRGMAPAACKCGPDYIDPMFHREVIGVYSRNLDLFFSDATQVRALVADSAAHSDVVVVEGVMGYYDGIAVSDEASAWDVARTIEAPAVLIIDGRGRARSIAAEVDGFARFRADSHVEGVVLNRVSDMLYPRLKEVIEAETGVRVYGYLPVLEDCSLESRHLGLVTASEIVDLQVKLDKLASAMERTVDIDGLLQLASSAPDMSESPWLEQASGFSSSGNVAPRIAVAHDDAFCFYYADALRLLQRLGAELVEFSPLADEGLPEGVSGMYLGGGYPELHARELSENAPMRMAISRAIRSGMPTIAECGGFMYLHDVLEDAEGGTYSEVGVVPGASFKTSKLGRFGYITLTAECDGLLAGAGDRLRAHEFHYWDSETPGNDFTAEKPQSGRSWKCGMSTPSLYAGYPHLYLPAHPQAARRFVDACAAYTGGKDER